MVKKKTKKHSSRKLKNERFNKPKNFEELIKRVKINTENIKIVHDDTEKRLVEILSNQVKILNFFESAKNIKRDFNEISHIVEKLENSLISKNNESGSDLKKIHSEIEKEFNRINSVFLKSLDKVKNKTNNLDLELSTLRERINNIKYIEETMKEMDIKKINREIEILKTKGEWVEDKINSIDSFPIKEKIAFIERKIKNIKYSSPLILE